MELLVKWWEHNQENHLFIDTSHSRERNFTATQSTVHGKLIALLAPASINYQKHKQRYLFLIIPCSTKCCNNLGMDWVQFLVLREGEKREFLLIILDESCCVQGTIALRARYSWWSSLIRSYKPKANVKAFHLCKALLIIYILFVSAVELFFFFNNFVLF